MEKIKPPQGLEKTAAQLDAIATAWQDDAIVASGRFFFYMNRAVAAQLGFLAQKPGEPGNPIDLGGHVHGAGLPTVPEPPTETDPR